MSYKKNEEEYYLVHWSGNFQDSWIKKADLSCDELIAAFHGSSEVSDEISQVPQVSNQVPRVPQVSNQDPPVSNQVTPSQIKIYKVLKPQKKSKAKKERFAY